MKKISITTLIVILISSLSFSIKDSIKSIEIGTKAPMSSQKLKDISGNEYSLESLKKENGLLVIFSCNSCPFVVGNQKQKAGKEDTMKFIK